MRTATLGKRLLAAMLGMGLVLWLTVVSGWAGAQEALDAFNSLFDPNLGLKLTHEQFEPPVTNIRCCGVTYPEVWSIPEARLQANQRQTAALSPVSMSPFRSNFLGSGARIQAAPMFVSHVRDCWIIWVMQ